MLFVLFQKIKIKKREESPRRATPLSVFPSPATQARELGSSVARDRSRVVSLQKGTNQPATRMSLNRSQRSCRSTKYGTQAKT